MTQISLEKLVRGQTKVQAWTFVHEVPSSLLLGEIQVIRRHLYQHAIFPAETSFVELHDVGDLPELPF